MNRITEMSPKAKARLAGVLFLVTMIAGGFAQGYVGGRLIVSNDAAATATRIMSHMQLYRLAFATYLIEMSCQIAMTVLFYELLKPVSKSASLVAATFGLIGCTIKTLARLFFISPVLLLGGAKYLSVFDPKQLQALVLLALRVNYMAETMAVVFFGLNTVIMGYLILKSTFWPKALGVISVVGGLGWMIYLYEPLAARLEGFIVGVGVLGALMTVVWLLVYGLNEARWKEQASVATASIWQ